MDNIRTIVIDSLVMFTIGLSALVIVAYWPVAATL